MIWPFVLILGLTGLLASAPMVAADDSCHGEGCLITECLLRGNLYKIKIHKVTEIESELLFSSKEGRLSDTNRIKVPGVLSEFALHDGDFIVTTVNPGPTTRIFAYVEGRIQQIFECTSPFGALLLPSVTRQLVGCPAGKKFLNDLVVPMKVAIYERSDHGYRFVAETPFETLYDTLGKLTKR